MDLVPARHPASRFLVLTFAFFLAAGACTSRGSSLSSSSRVGKRIPQPDVAGLNVAPDSARVDVRVPRFSHPTKITNPYFPVSRQRSILFLGRVDNKPFRTEVTLLADTRPFEWEGQSVETLVIQYNAYLGGKIEEIAYDYYAQADDGGVWYFGEDVSDFKDGRIFGTQGTWTAGKDGPAAMIMPGHPRVGQAYRAENIPGVAFEQVTIKSVDETLDGPLGPIPGGLLAEELHSDGTTEKKLFAPGYGEFFTGGGGDTEAMALAIPVNAAQGSAPAELGVLRSAATAVSDAARTKNWGAASRALATMIAAWKTYSAGEVPKLVASTTAGALARLVSAVRARGVVPARLAAIEVARLILDLELRYRAPADVDIARFDLWVDEFQVDAAAGDEGGANADFFAIDYIRDRILHVLDRADIARIDTHLDELQSAMHDGDLGAAGDAATKLREAVKGPLANAQF